MAKFYGKVGFVRVSDGGFGSWNDELISERTYRGEITRDVHSWQSSGYRNDDFSLDMVVSLVADTYIREHLNEIKYVKLTSGDSWKVSRIELNKPRITLHLGDVYNGAFGE